MPSGLFVPSRDDPQSIQNAISLDEKGKAQWWFDNAYCIDKQGNALLIDSDIKIIEDSLYIMTEPGWRVYTGHLKPLEDSRFYVRFKVDTKTTDYAGQPFTDTVREAVFSLNLTNQNTIQVGNRRYWEDMRVPEMTRKKLSSLYKHYFQEDRKE